MRVSLCMIVRNEEANLAACLECVADLVDEIVIADTGSTDATTAIAERAGVVLVQHPWREDFAAARNAALERATQDWTLWLDADDRLDAENKARLAALLRGLEDVRAGFEMTCESPLEAGIHRSRQVRLFRRLEGVRWRGRVHEQIAPAIQASGGRLLASDVVVRHIGYADPARHRAKLERNLRLLELACADDPGDAYLLYQLGWTRIALGQAAGAIELLERAIALAPAQASYLSGMYGQLVRAHHVLREPQRGLARCLEGRRRFPESGELAFMEGILRMESGDLPGAAAAFEQLLQPGVAWICGDPDLTCYKAWQNLGAVQLRLGRLSEAERAWRAVLEEKPGFEPARQGLAAIERRRSGGAPR